jgi:hypothetical protein
VSLALGQLAHASTHEALAEEREALRDLFDTFNAAMAQIQLLRMARSTWRRTKSTDSSASSLGGARTRQYSTREWRGRRAALSDAVHFYQQAARKIL